MIENNILKLQSEIHAFEKKYHRPENSVLLIGASKGQSKEKIEQAYQFGISHFGENYLQEALPKMLALHNLSIQWHFIGPIQSNKTRKIAESFHWVHSVGNIKIAQRLNDQRPINFPPLNICAEINLDREESKHGLLPENLWEFLDFCKQLQHIKVQGLMCIPKQQTNFDRQKEQFHRMALYLQEAQDRGYDLHTLSMGMSQDFEAAIAEGSTMIRIGHKIFGQR